ncbi:uncharacterized protein LOC114354784 [Ostrinia furnacalis]|uniref:uncharacterized protein LOC114354784 n=1 Tax=Ostrinia furnacalis TaxID=93504 RepID=UPI0010403932|nr:uncharacterized protein LOC114354784 [Ostrinia furnacalis]
MEVLTKKIKDDLNIIIEYRDINTVYRIGKSDTNNGKERPVHVSFVNNWKKIEIMKKKKEFKNVYVSEDYPKEILDKRRDLLPKLKEEREKGKYAFIDYDKLVIKEGKFDNGKRKRNPSASPNSIEQPRKQQIKGKTNRLNAFNIMKNRSNSLPTEAQIPEKKT